jgi:heme/copper-type cytochrome/quinol oxidase subunit 4
MLTERHVVMSLRWLILHLYKKEKKRVITKLVLDLALIQPTIFFFFFVLKNNTKQRVWSTIQVVLVFLVMANSVSKLIWCNQERKESSEMNIATYQSKNKKIAEYCKIIIIIIIIIKCFGCCECLGPCGFYWVRFCGLAGCSYVYLGAHYTF